MTLGRDEALVRRRSRRVALQVSAVVAVAMLAISGVALAVLVRGQQAATDDLLRSTARTADDVGDPPGGTWVAITRPAGVAYTPGMPAELQAWLSQHAQARGLSTVLVDHREYRLLVVLRSAEKIEAVADLAPQRASRNRLIAGMLGVAAVSLLVAAAVGALIGRRAVRPLADALALQRTFIADASHELRTPLTLLSTRVQLLERGAVTEPVRQELTGVRRDITGMTDLVEDLLVAAEPDMPDARAKTDVTELVREVVQSAHPHAQGRSIALVVQSSGAAEVTAAQAALRRAVLALVDNAIDHSREGSTVTLDVEARGREVVIAVADEGPGLSQEEARRVFDRFHSGGQRAGRRHYGLGLALTHEVAVRHGGRLEHVPTPVGARFEMTLPRSRA